MDDVVLGRVGGAVKEGLDVVEEPCGVAGLETRGFMLFRQLAAAS